MLRNFRGTVCMCAVLCTLAGCATSAPDPPATTKNTQNGNNSIVAYIYISNTPASGNNSNTPNQITAYASDASGKLTAVPGSPFNEDVTTMAVNGPYLAAAAASQPLINTYNIHSDGSLAFASQTNYAQNNPKGCGTAGALFFDSTGNSLYVQEHNIDCANTGTASFTVQGSTGMLNYLGSALTGSNYDADNPASFSGNNQFAYAAGPSGCYIYSIPGFQRSSNGLLSTFDDGAPNYLPGEPGSFRDFVPDLAAADTANLVAVAEIPANPPGCAGLPARIAIYAADANGKLTTSSSYANMVVTAIVSPNDLKIAPSGHLLAIAGQEGLQVFHFNGTDPISSYTPLLTSDPVGRMFWDNSGHLYAISKKANRLHVFTVTNTSYQEAPGSPYAINGPVDIAVQPWPLPSTTQ